MAKLNKGPKKDKTEQGQREKEDDTEKGAHFKTFVKPSQVKTAPQPKGLRTQIYEQQITNWQQGQQPQLRPAPMAPPYGAQPQPVAQPSQAPPPAPTDIRYRNLENQPGNMYYKKPENP
jgi:hypothetical protein